MPTPRTQQIIDTLATRLREITVANGYQSDIGLNVQTERRETGVPVSPRCTVGLVNKFRPDDGRASTNEREISGVIEVEFPANFANANAAMLLADDDIDRTFDEYLQQPAALPVKFTESVYLDRPEGLPVVAVQIGWRTRYRR